MQNLTVIIATIAIVITWTTTVVAGTWWLSRQFSQTRHTMYGSIRMAKTELQEKLEDYTKESRGEFRDLGTKLEDHEKLDNERFEQLKLGIMKIELREQSRGEMFGPSRI